MKRMENWIFLKPERITSGTILNRVALHFLFESSIKIFSLFGSLSIPVDFYWFLDLSFYDAIWDRFSYQTFPCKSLIIIFHVLVCTTSPLNIQLQFKN